MPYVYILRCADDTYYTGWTTHLTARLAAHNRGSGAKYTHARRPVQLVYCEARPDKSEALKREAAIKKMPRAKKQMLVNQMKEGEQLEIYDANEKFAGIMPRALVHRCGLRHHVAHLWLVQKQNGVLGHWLQQRADDRPLYPGLYDLAATGHLDPGETPLEGVLREVREEIGLHLTEMQVIDVGTVEQKYSRPDGGFDDEQVYVFMVYLDAPPHFMPGNEVKRMIWVPLLEHQKMEEGAEYLQTSGECIMREEMCCLHDDEWKLFADCLARIENARAAFADG